MNDGPHPLLAGNRSAGYYSAETAAEKYRNLRRVLAVFEPACSLW